MQRFLGGTRYLIIIPVIGLAISAAFFFVFGGFGLLRLLFEIMMGIIEGFTHGGETRVESTMVVIEVVEYVHTFLVGTVLYITAVGLYQLFVHQIQFPGWLKIDSTEELETNLIGVTVVVLAVNFMSAVFVGGTEGLLDYGAGIALPIAALGLFIGLRSWSTKLTKETVEEEHKWEKSSTEEAQE